MDYNSQRQLEATLDSLERLANEDQETLKKKVYETFSGISFLMIEAKKAQFKKGWASEIVDRHNEPIFERGEAKILEEAAQKFIKPIFTSNSQNKRGGGPNVKASATGTLIKPTINTEDLSIDRTFWKVRDLIKSIDTQVKNFSRELGPFRLFYDQDTPDFRFPLPVPAPPPVFVSVVMVPINPRSIPIVIGLIIETIRLIFSVGPLSNDMTRKVLSLVLGLIDFLKGDWKQGILSMIGFFGETPLLAGLIGKVFLNLLDLVAPDIQERITMDIYQSGKSMCIGFILWGFANFAPGPARSAARAQFDALKKIVADSNGKIENIESSMQKSLQPAGLQLKLKEIPEDFVPTFDDMQNLQAIVRQPTIYCSKEFQEAIEPLRKIPPMRLVLELMNIPTDPQTLAFECKDHAGESLEDTMGASLEPQITPKEGSPIAMALEGPKMPEVPAAQQISELKATEAQEPIVQNAPAPNVPLAQAPLTQSLGKSPVTRPMSKTPRAPLKPKSPPTRKKVWRKGGTRGYKQRHKK
jgi:hypothetical protein